MDMITTIIIFYVMIHFMIMQFMSAWKDRSSYERALTVVAILILLLHGTGNLM